jgi:hypothetical protein
MIKLIGDGVLTGDVEECALVSGIMFQTTETANALMQHQDLDLKVTNYSVFKRHPELRDVVRTACQTGEFSGIAVLGESLLIC